MTPTTELPGWVHLSSGKVRDIYAPADEGAPASAPPADKGAAAPAAPPADEAGPAPAVLPADEGAPAPAPPAAAPATPEGAGPAAPTRLLMVTSDRISAYDHILPTPIPDKGKVLNQLSIWWMGQVEDIVPNHLLATAPPEVPDAVAGRAVVCRALEMAPIECVVRGYLTGSGIVEYRASGSVCGVALPAGLTEASKLPEPIFTPAAKAQLGDHDENISFARAVELVGEDLAARLRDTSLAIYARAAGIAAQRGVIIADTKFEFGVDAATGELVLADEVLTPDSSRFWPADEWLPGRVTPSFDKQYVRDWLTSPVSGWDRSGDTEPPALPDEVVAATRARYIQAFRRLTGADPVL